ncbi:MAG: regulatory protein RecX [Parachlamydiaceae bacterium]|nr:regulatory protein RecX [Parachlamydiaceae bacterium]
MKIEVKPHHNRKELFIIYIDGEPWREIHSTIFGKHPKFSSVQNQEQWENFFHSYEYKRVKGYVTWRLSSLSYHSEQLEKLLRERLVPLDLIQQVIQEHKDIGALDDDLWMQRFLQQQQKKYGLKHIIQKLYAKGFSRETLETISQSSDDGSDQAQELNVIKKLLISRYRSKDLTQYKEKQKVIASLMRKGFSYDCIKEAMRDVDS